MKNKLLFLLLAIISLNTIAQTPPNIPLIRLSESNNSDTINQSIACFSNATNEYHDNSFYRFYELQRYVNDNTIAPGEFIITNLQFAQGSAEDNTPLNYFVGTIDSDNFINGVGGFITPIDLNNLTILESGNYITNSSNDFSLINIPINPLTVSTNEIVFYAISIPAGDLDTHSFFMGGNFFGNDDSPAYFNSPGICDLQIEINDSFPNSIRAISFSSAGGSFSAIMNIFGISNPSALGPPANDTCETAQDLVVGTAFEDNPLDFATLNGTIDGGGCNNATALPQVAREIWLQCPVPDDGFLVVETAPDIATGDTSFVSGMDSWSGTCNNLTFTGCGSSSFTINDFSSIVVNGTPGETVFVRVFGNFVAPFSVSAYNPPIPSNLTCENAQPLNVGATFEDEAVEGSFIRTGSGDSIWYSFVAPADGNVTIETGPDARGNYTANTAIVLWTGTCTGLSIVGIDSNGADTFNFSRLEATGLTPGQTYFVTVQDDFQAFRSPFSISIFNDSTLGIDDNVFETFNYFPNPVNETLNFDSIENIDRVSVYSLLGQEMMNLESNQSAPIKEIDLSGLSNGIYLLRVSIANQSRVIRVIKE